MTVGIFWKPKSGFWKKIPKRGDYNRNKGFYLETIDFFYYGYTCEISQKINNNRFKTLKHNRL